MHGSPWERHKQRRVLNLIPTSRFRLGGRNCKCRVIRGHIQTAEHKPPEFIAGEVGCVRAEAGQFVAEAVVLEPAVESALSYAGGACGLSQGGSSGDDGQSLQPAGGKAGIFEFCTILYHSVPFWGVGSR